MDDKPPDYNTTVNQPELFPLQTFLQDGIPFSVTSSAKDSTTSSSDGAALDEKDELPKYDEIVIASVDAPSLNTWTNNFKTEGVLDADKIIRQTLSVAK